MRVYDCVRYNVGWIIIIIMYVCVNVYNDGRIIMYMYNCICMCESVYIYVSTDRSSVLILSKRERERERDTMYIEGGRGLPVLPVVNVTRQFSTGITSSGWSNSTSPCVGPTSTCLGILRIEGKMNYIKTRYH